MNKACIWLQIARNEMTDLSEATSLNKIMKL